MKPLHKYEIVVWWSEQDELFLAKAPELGCIVHGDSTESSFREINALIPFWLETLEREGRKVPLPRGELVPVS